MANLIVTIFQSRRRRRDFPGDIENVSGTEELNSEAGLRPFGQYGRNTDNSAQHREQQARQNAQVVRDTFGDAAGRTNGRQ